MRRMASFGLIAAGFVLLSVNLAIAQDHGNGHGKGHEKHENDEDAAEHYYKTHDRDEIHGWYVQHANDLPPGLAKKDQLPPGLQKQLVRRGTLPPGLQKKIEPCPEQLERRLPPPPPDCAHVVIGGNLVLLNRKTNVVVDFLFVDAR